MIETARRESSAGAQRMEGQLLPKREIGKLPRRANIAGVQFGGVLRDRAGEGIGLDSKTGALFSSPCTQGTLHRVYCGHPHLTSTVSKPSVEAFKVPASACGVVILQSSLQHPQNFPSFSSQEATQSALRCSHTMS